MRHSARCLLGRFITSIGEQGGVKGAAETIVPVLYLDVRAEAGARFNIDAPASDVGFIYMVSGEVEFDGQGAKAETTVHINAGTGPEGGQVAVSARTASRFVFLAGPKLGEPIVHYGPFVMSTQAEIAQVARGFSAASSPEAAHQEPHPHQ